ncbi:MAG TPA: hypothetical protein PKH24_16535 [Sedimentisphaerales bacterium]|jgi:hypothetical protein|nr:hypothetical protein [Sedimentisphaerales bacterium]HNU30113.1 hypothetical protein [Sedimentisphaerales bacterium]
MPGETRRETPTAAVLGWAAYLACSWTWCIGLFLPVLLVRELGTLGFVIFAVPNVVGAAMMGTILPSAFVSSQVVQRHRPALVAFSAVTVAFHLFFAAWMVPRLIGPMGPWIVLALVAVFTCIALRRRDRSDLVAAAVVLAVTAGIALFALRNGLDFSWAPSPDPIAVAALAPVCAFGFLLCPYLDLTFHRVRQRTSPAAGRVAFGVGFGVLFLAVILFSYGYARPLAVAVDGEAPRGLVKAFALPLGLYMAMQIAYTVALHIVEVIREAKALGGRYSTLIALVLAGGAAALGFVCNRGTLLYGLDAGEVIYRCFMGFFGLLFPAYVWLCMLRRSPSRRAMRICAVAVVAALPLFFVGFVAGRMVLLVPGVAIVLLARLVRTGVSQQKG